MLTHFCEDHCKEILITSLKIFDGDLREEEPFEMFTPTGSHVNEKEKKYVKFKFSEFI